MKLLPSKRFWKRLAAVLAILAAIALLVNGILAWRTDRRLAARVAAIRAAGDPASIAELAPPPIPDAENPAAILERVRPRLKEFTKANSDFYYTPLGMAYDKAHHQGEPASKEQLDAIRAILANFGDVEQAIADAANCDKHASRLDFSLSHTKFIEALVEAAGKARDPARLLIWRIELLLAEGQTDAAVKRGIQLFRLARHYDSEPSLVSNLVAVALRGMAAEQMYDAFAAGPVSPELAAALDAELARIDDPQRVVRTLKTERAIVASWDGAPPGQPIPVFARALSWPLKSYQIGAMDYQEELLSRAGSTWHETLSHLGPPGQAMPASGHGVLADLLGPAIKAAFQANARIIAVSRALRIHILLRQFAAKNGREASGLEELSLPKEVTIDPFTGQPLKLKQTEDGWVIYSVMDNGVDDGGDFRQLKDYGLGPTKHRVVR